MASTRLTVAIKEALVSQLIDHAFADRCRKLVAAECALAQEIYDHTMDTRFLKVEGGKGPKLSLRKIVAALPAGWESRSNYFKAEVGGQVMRFGRYKGMSCGYSSGDELVGTEQNTKDEIIPWAFKPGFVGSHTINAYDANHEFSRRAVELQGVREDLVKEISSMRISTRATLDSATTVQKLISIWPEVEVFAAPFLKSKTADEALLPVVARERLNKALGLPPSHYEGLEEK